MQHLVKGKALHLLIDSTVVVAYCKNGGGPVEILSDILKDIWTWAVQWQVDLVGFEWIPSKSNKEADFQSRVVDLGDWSIHPNWFRKADSQWGPHSVDRMASNLNHQVPRFNST